MTFPPGVAKKNEHPLYNTWAKMLSRCNNQKCPAYHNYGGRGIKVCERWKEFWNFAYDMGQRPDGYTLERVDNDGDYEPGNCTWATPYEQGQNTRRTRPVTIDGETHSIETWMRRLGMSRHTIRHIYLGEPKYVDKNRLVRKRKKRAERHMGENI